MLIFRTRLRRAHARVRACVYARIMRSRVAPACAPDPFPPTFERQSTSPLIQPTSQHTSPPVATKRTNPATHRNRKSKKRNAPDETARRRNLKQKSSEKDSLPLSGQCLDRFFSRWGARGRKAFSCAPGRRKRHQGLIRPHGRKKSKPSAPSEATQTAIYTPDSINYHTNTKTHA